MERGDKDLAKSEAEKASTEDAIASSEAAIEEMTASSESLAEEVPLLRCKLRGQDASPASVSNVSP